MRPLPGAANGMFEAAFGGMKPPVGVPPFAPAGWDQSGGANVPTTPQTQPVKRGFSGFLDRVLNPTNALGQFGQALVAGGGGPLGNAMAYMMQQHAEQQKLARTPSKFDEWRQQYDYELGHPKAREQADDAFDRALKGAGIDPAGEQGRALYGQRAATLASPAPQMIGSAEDGYRFVTPPAPTLGGGAPQGVLGADLPPGWKVQGGPGATPGGFPY